MNNKTMKITVKNFLFALTAGYFMISCTPGTEKVDPKENKPKGGTVSAIIDGEKWESKTAAANVLFKVTTVAGIKSETDNLSIQLTGDGVETGREYRFEIPAKEEHKLANLVFNGLFSTSGYIKFSTYSPSKMEGTFEARLDNYVGTQKTLTNGKFSINL